MTGFKPKRTLYKLDFTGTDLEGLEITARRTSVDGLLELAGISERVDELKQLDENADVAEAVEKARQLFAPLAKVIVSWNVVDDDDEPVPANLDGLLSQETDFISSLLDAYVTSMASAPPPLPAGSPSGTTSPEALTAAASLSSALPSSSPPNF